MPTPTWRRSPIGSTGSPSTSGGLDAWIGTLAFSGQIFFDFAGYSTCAIGVATMLGFVIPRQLPVPPLRGARLLRLLAPLARLAVELAARLSLHLARRQQAQGSAVGRTQVNLMLTMLLGGLWHGAAWHFVVWGGPARALPGG